MKVIFLDIDGVLNTTKSRQNQMIPLDFNKLNLLSEIWRETGAKIVLTSEWRCVDYLRISFDLVLEHIKPEEFDFAGGYYDTVRKNTDRPRRELIREWLDNLQKIPAFQDQSCNFVVVDDQEKAFGEGGEYYFPENRCFKINPLRGLSRIHRDGIIEQLGRSSLEEILRPWNIERRNVSDTGK